MAMTARLTPELVKALFAEAHTLEFGLRIPIEVAYQSRATNYISDVMRDHPDREGIMVCGFPKDNEMWLVKKTVEVII